MTSRQFWIKAFSLMVLAGVSHRVVEVAKTTQNVTHVHNHTTTEATPPAPEVVSTS